MFNIKSKLSFLLFYLTFTLIINQILTYQIDESGSEKIVWVNHTHDVILESERFLTAIKDMETGQRGYLLTRNAHYLLPYDTGLKRAKSGYKKLLQLTQDNPLQQKRLQEIDKLMLLKFSELKQTIDLVNQNRYKQALDIVRGDQGNMYMHKIRDLLNSFVMIEKQLLEVRKDELKTVQSESIYLVRIILLILISVVFYLLYRTLNQKVTLQQRVDRQTKKLQKINLSLEERVKKRTQELEHANLKALNASKSKSVFLANMSHEIRTPLNAVLGFIDLLKREVKEGKGVQYLEIIDKSSVSLLNIIEDILDFSKIESGKLDIEKINFDVREELGVITHLFDAKCSQKNVTLILDIDDKVPQYINSDPLRIKQVISNLLSNAVKFTSKDKKIYVTIDYEDGMLSVSVRDEGIGISKENQEAIFKPFGQEDSSVTRKFGGTGLGLSISKELVALLGGELKLKSEVNVGSEFYFYLPVEVADSSDIETEELEDIGFSGKVLVVEDNKANQLLLQILLEEMSIEHEIANDGLEAIEKFKANRYDLILMDENMPNMGGIEATQKILALEKEGHLKHTPIVALTANALKGDKERFMSAGMDEYQSKPLDRNKLIHLFHRVFPSAS